MAPKKKAQKISLNEFLGDSTLGSWADEMEALPSAPAARSDDDRTHDRHGRRDDFTSRSDRGPLPSREDIPLPTKPPYTAFVGNLAFDLTETELEEFFGSTKTKTVKIIRDKDDKPKGFGYVEFTDLNGLKDAIVKSGSNFSGRTIRISVAEPVKERPGFPIGSEDDAKFENSWRRDRPLHDLPDSRDSSRRRFDVPVTSDRPSLSEGATDWRSNRAFIRPLDPEDTFSKQKASDGQLSTADKEQMWTIGSKFKPAPPLHSDDGFNNKFGGSRRGELGPPTSVNDEADWRSSLRQRPATRNSTSPTNSVPSTPQINRRKLELLPRSGSTSATTSPLSSPKIIAASTVSNSRSNPFGEAKPVDVTSREKEVAERLQKARESLKPHPISRPNSRSASEQGLANSTRTPPLAGSTLPIPKSSAINVHPSLTFATVASVNKDSIPQQDENQVEKTVALTENIAEVVV